MSHLGKYLQMKNKQKYRKPTVDEFLAFIPRRRDFKWTTDKEGLVHVTVPKFESKIGKKFCSLLRKKQNITADMDALGSLVWQNCDGNRTVKDIFKILEKDFSDQTDLQQRLFLFIQQMGLLHYLEY